MLQGRCGFGSEYLRKGLPLVSPLAVAALANHRMKGFRVERKEVMETLIKAVREKKIDVLFAHTEWLQ